MHTCMHTYFVINVVTTQQRHKRIKPEQRVRVQVTLKPSLYQIVKDYAEEKGMFPGAAIEYAITKAFALEVPK